MDPPGFSLFQGGESIRVDDHANRAAEEEAEDLLDRKRREEELARQLQNAFDDLQGEDDETLDNSYRSGTSYHSEAPDLAAAQMKYKRNYMDDEESTAEGNAIYRLRMELQSKTNELVHVNTVLAEERQRVNDLTKQLALSEAERDRSHLTKNQTHELLVESKTKICDLDDMVTKLKDRNRMLETEKSQLKVDLENSRIMLNDTQMKCHMMEKEIGRGGGGMNNSRQQDAAFKQLNDRNNAQMEILQKQIDTFRDRLEAKDVDLRTLEAKYRDLQKNREILLIEKSETINELTEKLERSQRQCQDLLSSQTNRADAENVRLRNKITGLETHIENLQKTTDGLLRQLEKREDFANVLESTPHMRKKPHLGIAGLEETGALMKEIGSLRQEVTEKANEIKNLLQTEQQLLEKIKQLEESPRSDRGECDDCRITRTQLDELIKLNKTLSESNADLQEINQRIMAAQEEDNQLVMQKLQEFRVLQQLITDQKAQIDQLETEKSAMEAKFDEDRKKMREISDNSLKCMMQMKNATELEVKNMQWQSDCMGYLKNLKGLRAASAILSEVEGRSVSTSTSPSREGKTYCDRSVMVSTPSDGSSTVTDSSDLSAQKSAIIEEYAKLSAAEIKKIEEKYRRELFTAQQQLVDINGELERLKKTYSSETSLFKEVILAERDEYEELLAQKEKEIREVMRKLDEVQRRSSRDQKEEELLNSLQVELKKKQVEIEEERNSMAILHKQWKEERKQLMAIEEHLKKEMDVLRENCRSAKKTAANYKRYTEEKDQFINREIERMRLQYEGVIDKLRLKCRKHENKC